MNDHFLSLYNVNISFLSIVMIFFPIPLLSLCLYCSFVIFLNIYLILVLFPIDLVRKYQHCLSVVFKIFKLKLFFVMKFLINVLHRKLNECILYGNYMPMLSLSNVVHILLRHSQFVVFRERAH